MLLTTSGLGIVCSVSFYASSTAGPLAPRGKQVGERLHRPRAGYPKWE